jgi:hypothetical protein
MQVHHFTFTNSGKMVIFSPTQIVKIIAALIEEI